MAQEQLIDVLCAREEADDLLSLFEAEPVRIRLLREPPTEPAFYLTYRGGILELRRQGDNAGLAVQRRDLERRLAGDFMLGRACGLKRGASLSIIDATAGLGIDAMALALRGQRLTLVERQPQLWALLIDLRARLGLSEVFVHCLDHQSVLETSAPADVIYFDPMFPQRRKGALPGKAMQYLAMLVEEDGAFDERFIDLARRGARQRVVLKRRARDPALATPDWSIRGRSIRYDVYRGLHEGSGK